MAAIANLLQLWPRKSRGASVVKVAGALLGKSIAPWGLVLGLQPIKYIYASSGTEARHQQCVSVCLVNRLISILKIKMGYLQVSITRRRIMSNHSIYSTLLPSPNVQTCNVEGKCLTFYLLSH